MKAVDIKVPEEDKGLFLSLFGEEVKRRPFSPNRRWGKSLRRARTKRRKFLVFTIYTEERPKLRHGWRILKRNRR